MLVGGLRMLLGDIRMFLALGMVALTMVFSSGTVSLRSIFVMLGSLVMFVSSHLNPRRLSAPSLRLQTCTLRIVPELLQSNIEFI
jgi:hypothetical protein